MSISQRKDGRFCVKYKDRLTGKWKQQSFHADQEAEARQFDAEHQYETAQSGRLTVKEAVLTFLDNTEHARWGVLNYKWLICGADNKLTGKHSEGYAEFLADKYVDELTKADLDKLRSNARNKHLKPQTINFWVILLRAVFNWCADQDMITENPWRKYKQLKPSQPRHRFGTLEDFNKVYQHLPPWLQWACRTALALCLRPGNAELFSLEWSAFDWRNNSVTMYMPKVKLDKTVYPPKEYMEEAYQRYQQDTKNGFTLVCRNAKDERVVRYSPAWRKACNESGVNIPMYCIRHIAATQMLAKGADIAAVSAQLGHQSIATTGKFYAHVLTSAQKTASQALSGLVQDGAGNADKNE